MGYVETTRLKKRADENGMPLNDNKTNRRSPDVPLELSKNSFTPQKEWQTCTIHELCHAQATGDAHYDSKESMQQSCWLKPEEGKQKLGQHGEYRMENENWESVPAYIFGHGLGATFEESE